jgi:hypothetical protein
VFRAALFTYLIVSAAIGPAICCCQLKQFLGVQKSSPCCALNQIATKQDKANSHEHCSRCKHATQDDDLRNALASDGLGSDNSIPTPKSPCQPNCPCGRHEPGLIGTAPGLVNSNLIGQFPSQEYGYASSIAIPAVNYLAFVGGFEHEKPVAISGREILRAYQILRC